MNELVRLVEASGVGMCVGRVRTLAQILQQDALAYKTRRDVLSTYAFGIRVELLSFFHAFRVLSRRRYQRLSGSGISKGSHLLA